MKQPATIELYTYWNLLRGARLSPEREEVDPLAIRHILADTMMLETDEDRTFPVRISGTRLNALFLDEQKGRAFIDLFAPDERQSAAAMILSMLNGARPVVATLTAAPQGEEPATLELLLLPLRHRGKAQARTPHARILGALSPIAIPSWLGLRPALCLRMISMRFIEDGGLAQQTPEELTHGMIARRRAFSVIPGGRPARVRRDDFSRAFSTRRRSGGRFRHNAGRFSASSSPPIGRVAG